MKVRTQERGVSPESTNANRRGEGVENPEIFAYVLNGWPLLRLFIERSKIMTAPYVNIVPVSPTNCKDI